MPICCHLKWDVEVAVYVDGTLLLADVADARLYVELVCDAIVAVDANGVCLSAEVVTSAETKAKVALILC